MTHIPDTSKKPETPAIPDGYEISMEMLSAFQFRGPIIYSIIERHGA